MVLSKNVIIGLVIGGILISSGLITVFILTYEEPLKDFGESPNFTLKDERGPDRPAQLSGIKNPRHSIQFRVNLTEVYYGESPVHLQLISTVSSLEITHAGLHPGLSISKSIHHVFEFSL